MRSRNFTQEEDCQIRAHAGQPSWAPLAARLGRTAAALSKRAYKLGTPLRRLRRWTVAEDAVILSARGRSLEEVAAQLRRGISEVSVRSRRILKNPWRWHRNGDRWRPQRGYAVSGYRITKGPTGKRVKAVMVHQQAMEARIGRPLTDEERVHHIDGDRTNNALDNLHLFRNASEHRLAHVSAERVAMELVKRGRIRFDRASGTYRIADEVHRRDERVRGPEHLAG